MGHCYGNHGCNCLRIYCFHRMADVCTCIEETHFFRGPKGCSLFSMGLVSPADQMCIAYQAQSQTEKNNTVAFSLCRALLLMWHAPFRIFWLIGVPFLIYVADFFVGIFVRTHLIENVYFERLGKTGVSVSDLFHSFQCHSWFATRAIQSFTFPSLLQSCILRILGDFPIPRHHMYTSCVHGCRSGWVIVLIIDILMSPKGY